MRLLLIALLNEITQTELVEPARSVTLREIVDYLFWHGEIAPGEDTHHLIHCLACIRDEIRPFFENKLLEYRGFALLNNNHFACLIFPELISRYSARYNAEWLFAVKDHFVRVDNNLVKLFEMPHLSATSVTEALTFILSDAYKNTLLKSQHRQKDHQAICFRDAAVSLHKTVYSADIQRFILGKLIKRNDIESILFILANRTHLHPLPLNDYKVMVNMAAEQQKWHDVRLMCGLSDDKKCAHLFSENNMALFLDVLKNQFSEDDDQALVVRDMAEALLMDIMKMTTANGDTVLHRAANVSDFNIIAEVILFLKKHIVSSKLLELLNIENNQGVVVRADVNREDRDKINVFLNKERAGCMRNIRETVPDFWSENQSRGQKRCREEREREALAVELNAPSPVRSQSQ